VTATVEIVALADAGPKRLEELAQMKRAVYPEAPESYPETAREWSPQQWGVFVNDDGVLVSYTGVVIRDVVADGSRVLGGGIGGVATHPARRGKGYAPLGMGRALDFLHSRGVQFALLVCREQLVAYYESLGWRRFTGEMLVRQHGEREVFTFNDVMVGDLTGKAPTSAIDLLGAPW
jgi:GNAT superfamily N-acetyltransferase